MYKFQPCPLLKIAVLVYPCDNLCCISNLLNDLPSISGRCYPEKVSVEGAVNQRKLSPGLSRIRLTS